METNQEVTLLTPTSAPHDEMCEVCERGLVYNEDCFAYGIGGGWALACASCVEAAVADGSAILIASQSSQVRQ